MWVEVLVICVFAFHLAQREEERERKGPHIIQENIFFVFQLGLVFPYSTAVADLLL